MRTCVHVYLLAHFVWSKTHFNVFQRCQHRDVVPEFDARVNILVFWWVIFGPPPGNAFLRSTVGSKPLLSMRWLLKKFFMCFESFLFINFFCSVFPALNYQNICDSWCISFHRADRWSYMLRSLFQPLSLTCSFIDVHDRTFMFKHVDESKWSIWDSEWKPICVGEWDNNEVCDCRFSTINVRQDK